MATTKEHIKSFQTRMLKGSTVLTLSLAPTSSIDEHILRGGAGSREPQKNMNLSSMPCQFLEGYVHILVASVGEDLKDDDHQKSHKNRCMKARTNRMSWTSKDTMQH